MCARQERRPQRRHTTGQVGYGGRWQQAPTFKPGTKPSGEARPPAVLDESSSFDPLDIDEARPLEDIDEATLERVKEEAWKEAMIDMDWSCAKTIDDFPSKSPVLSALWVTDLDDLFDRLESTCDPVRGPSNNN
ncbi:hypothetical protein pqer_cds_523 [Pandoravirus quercus]|uniref:Uncharacterized protein n=1 Tax=Pandoravirus quercus TaxID=2107709 RepID=A0A2U7U978_9VIRU|nr:hypothetical protein pqer_cds_523 [Pandoravirus quercus]AVK74945.1 hypothetical protein pqer_cds_523 [Pandoravirus quercus]